MAFYKSISDHYDFIFPLQKAQIGFVTDICDDESELKILDIGCGTGSLCIELSQKHKNITGIDPDESMLKMAEQKARHANQSPRFLPYGMLELENNYKPGAFDVILCFGNTLVHLDNEDEIKEFLYGSFKLLPAGGRLLIQIINYDRIIDQDIKALPTIENEHIQFIRNYEYDLVNNQLSFETILHIKSTDEYIQNVIQLYPIRKAALDALLKEAGFQKIRYYGNFNQSAFQSDSIPLIINAQK